MHSAENPKKKKLTAKENVIIREHAISKLLTISREALHPYTLHPTPYTLHPTPYTLHPTPYTLSPKSYLASI
ncbi:hypothetical protein COW94_04045 [Candidatus Peregrinibacteria bacterium CG22_combo_CG10-13_8_21_14_all_44_10]|nr:MAG: hypothetical protein COW94_04045 [Candidatus Peregrinibacteria bacterium CG22_combo_CG10-13_8_21_14_all_44_10]